MIEKEGYAILTKKTEGEGVTGSYANQLWMFDYHCYEILDSDTSFDLRLLIKRSMF